MVRFVAAALLLAVPAHADLVVLGDGDRITGQVLSKGPRRVRLQTPYGLLLIPRDKVARIVKDDGTEDLPNAPAPAPPPAPPPAPRLVRLVIAVTGASFWQAWNPKASPTDPSLRLLVELDGQTEGAYRDPLLDPDDLPKATVNTFSFLPDSVARENAPGVKLLPPEPRPGGVQLALELPPAAAGAHKLRVSYQVNDGAFDAPQWRDVVEASLDVVLAPGAATTLRLGQSRGSMEFVKKRMQAVESFGLVLDTPAPAP